MRGFLRQLRPALLAVVVFTVATGVVYPLVVTAVGAVAFGDRAGGSLVRSGGEVVGSRLLGQAFTGEQYFHPRPSAAGDGYDATTSSGSNLGPTSEDLLTAVADRAVAYRALNGLAPDAMVPVDAVTASGSGLDPLISLANARLQAPRIAAARGVDVATVERVITDATDGRELGFLGDPGVNVLEANVALDRLAG